MNQNISLSHPLKIGILVDRFPVRSETFIMNHVLGLVNRGYVVTVMSCGVGEDISRHEIEKAEQAGIKRIYLPCFGVNRISNLLYMTSATCRHIGMIKHWSPFSSRTRREMFWAYEAWRVLQKLKPDIIHIHFGNIANWLVKYRLPHKAIVTWHGYDANKIPYILGNNIYKELFEAPVHHTVGSSFMRKRLEILGAVSQHIDIVPMGVDVDFFSYKERHVSLADTLRIVSVGRLNEVKGHEFLIQAVIEMLDEGAKIRLYILGDGHLREKLSNQIVDSKHQSKISLLGSRKSSEVLSELHNAHLFCLTGVESTAGIEAQGLVFAEAQATGLPVIGSSIGGIPDSLINGETGILCPPGNVPEIKKAIIFFLKNRQAINEFGQKGRKFVESRFSLDRMIDSFERIYKTTYCR